MASSGASKKLLKDIKDFTQLQDDQSGLEYRFRFEFAPDNMKKLDIYISQITPERDSNIEKQMEKLGIPHLHLEYTISDNHPFNPPFVRFITPRFVFRTGHVTMGGSICMELLTNQGWMPTTSIENVLRQIILELQIGGGEIDEANPGRVYGLGEAKDAYARMLASHGWK